MTSFSITDVPFFTYSSSNNFYITGSRFWAPVTGKNNRFPFLDILGYLKNTHKNPNLEEWDKSQSGNLVGNSLVGTCLTLPNLEFLWVFFKYPKKSKNGNPLFFPVCFGSWNLATLCRGSVSSVGRACWLQSGRSRVRFLGLAQYSGS